jgi:hypothetical protein
VGALWLDQSGRRTGRDGGSNHLKGTGDHPGSPVPTHTLGRQLYAGTSALELGYAILIVEPMDVPRDGMACTDRPALPVSGGAAIGRDVADRRRLAAALCHGLSILQVRNFLSMSPR